MKMAMKWLNTTASCCCFDDDDDDDNDKSDGHNLDLKRYRLLCYDNYTDSYYQTIL